MLIQVQPRVEGPGLEPEITPETEVAVCSFPDRGPRIGAISSASASFFSASPFLHCQHLCPSPVLPRPLQTSTSHSQLFLFFLLPYFQHVPPPPWPLQPANQSPGLFPQQTSQSCVLYNLTFAPFWLLPTHVCYPHGGGLLQAGSELSFYCGCIRLLGSFYKVKTVLSVSCVVRMGWPACLKLALASRYFIDEK